MIALVQRVEKAKVSVQEKPVASIGNGLLLFLGVEKGDSEDLIEKLVNKIINFRIFPDESGKMNLSLLETNRELLLVSQFTLAGNTSRGRRPSFDTAAVPELAKELYEKAIKCFNDKQINTQTGQFGADMKVELINDGPVTFSFQF